MKRIVALVVAIIFTFSGVGFQPLSIKTIKPAFAQQQEKEKKKVKKQKKNRKNKAGSKTKAIILPGKMATSGTGSNAETHIEVMLPLKETGNLYVNSKDGKFKIKTPIAIEAKEAVMDIPIKEMPGTNTPDAGEKEKPCMGSSTYYIGGGSTIGGACIGASVTGVGAVACGVVAIYLIWKGVDKNDSKPICEIGAGIIGGAAGVAGGQALAHKAAADGAAGSSTTVPPPPAP